MPGLFRAAGRANYTYGIHWVPGMPPVFGAGSTDRVLLCLGLREMSCGAGRRGVSRRLLDRVARERESGRWSYVLLPALREIEEGSRSP